MIPNGSGIRPPQPVGPGSFPAGARIIASPAAQWRDADLRWQGATQVGIPPAYVSDMALVEPPAIANALQGGASGVP
jgi:hypothetical protein